jgi:hypothetical protein
VIKAESQAVVNTLMAHNFQDAFKKRTQVLETVHMRRKYYYESDGDQ